jgi:hypothetical protein
MSNELGNPEFGFPARVEVRQGVAKRAKDSAATTATSSGLPNGAEGSAVDGGIPPRMMSPTCSTT